MLTWHTIYSFHEIPVFLSSRFAIAAREADKNTWHETMSFDLRRTQNIINPNHIRPSTKWCNKKIFRENDPVPRYASKFLFIVSSNFWLLSNTFNSFSEFISLRPHFLVFLMYRHKTSQYYSCSSSHNINAPTNGYSYEHANYLYLIEYAHLALNSPFSFYDASSLEFFPISTGFPSYLSRTVSKTFRNQVNPFSTCMRVILFPSPVQ